MQVTDAQLKYLKALGVPRTELDGLTKRTASDLIDIKVAEVKAAPPSPAQLRLLTVSMCHFGMQMHGSTSFSVGRR